MGIIKFEDWKKNPQQYQDGVNQFEITFGQWADSEYNFAKVLNDAKDFYIINEHNENVLPENLKDYPDQNYLEQWSFFSINYTNKILTQNDFNIKQSGLYQGIINKESKYKMNDFYTLLVLWCLKKNNDKINISDIRSENSSGTGRYMKLGNEDFHLGVGYKKLYPRAKYLFQNYLKDDYSGYKVIFTPKSEDNYNGGKKNMSDATDNKIEINEYIKEKIDAHKQIIFTGAPGTGKTHSVREYVKGKNDEYKEKMKSTDKKHEDIEDIYKFVQFHSSYDYTDFVEGIRPAPKEKSGENMFVRMDGIFKAFCRKIVDANIKDLEKHGIDNIEALYKIMKESKTDTNAIKERRKNIAKAISELPMYYFVIDEINRADLSKVFGELMFGLEEDYRGVQNRFPTQYSNLPTYEMKEDKAVIIEKDCFKNGFFVPENLTIIGTMNDIDRSVETFDFALRRRFAWVEIKANEVMLYSVAAINGIEDNKIDDDFNKTIENIKQMNNVISDNTYKKLGLNESYHIGPAYFKNLFDGGDIKNNLETIFKEKIEPLLREYTRGRDTKTVNDLIDNCRGKLELPKKYSGGNNG